MVHKIELRTHAGAPSSRQDDDQYRALAAAYVGFTGHRLQDTVDVGSVQRQPPLALQVLRSDDLRENTEGGGFTIIGPEDSTFIDDTQLAYNALESQLNTSSLTAPEITPLKRPPPDSDDGSPWPDDLEQQSPHARSQAGDGMYGSSPPVVTTAVARHSAKKLRVQQNAFEGLTFKPFKLPVQRAPTVGEPGPPARRKPGLATPEPRKTSQESAVTRSSYLKTPILVTPEQRKKNEPRQVEVDGGRDRAVDISHAAAHPPSPSKVVDYRERTPRAKAAVRYAPLPDGSGVGIAFIGDAQVEQQSQPPQNPHRQSQVSGSGAETTSELPTSYSLSDLTSQSSRARLRHSQRSTSDPGPLGTGSDVGAEHDASARSASEPLHHGLVVKAQSVDPLARPSSRARSPARVEHIERVKPLKCPPNEPDESSTSSAAVAFDVSSLPLIIRPPEPTVSLGTFTTHVTADLKKLLETPDIVGLWKPVSLTRDVFPLERGYWLVKPTKWPTQLQLDFWRALERTVGAGLAGWGVWCTRECEPPRGSAGKSENDLGPVRIHCWGEVIEHIYALLYVASMNKVRKLGLQWIDAEGKVVVQMRSG